MWKEYYNSGEMKDTRRKLRNNATKYEKIMWEKLRWDKFLGLKFRRQHSVWRYILDFYCPKIKLWIELKSPSKKWCVGIWWDKNTVFRKWWNYCI